MADNKKIYSIQINGIDQSIKQVDALSDALQFLDKKIKELESRSVSITSSNNGGGGNRTAELNTEDKLLKQIQSTEQQIRYARREDYQSLLAQKDLLKDITNEAKQRAAAERLLVGNYGNTMNGLKQELSDIKTVMQATDLGSGKFNELTQKAGELTNKLKELDQSYGQFGRNVGNYKSAFDDVKKVTVQVGNTAREFKSVRDASRQLTQELKAMTIAGKEGTQEYKELAEAVHNFEMASRRAESAVNDLKASSQGMDDIMDMMESFGSIGQITQGFSALFGFDDTEIERSIQKLVGLQNAMQGIEKIRQQMNTGEGIGKIFQGGNQAVDSFVSKLTGAKIGLNGLTKGSKVATFAVRGLSMALKGLLVGLVLEGVNMLLQAFERLTTIMNSNKATVDELNSSMNALNKEYEKRTNSTQLALMRGEISNNEYLARLYKEQNDYIQESIDLLNQRAKLANKRSWYDVLDVSGSNTGYTGQRLTGSTTIGTGHLWSFTDIFGNEDFDFSYTINSIEEAREAWKKLNAAVSEGKDYFSKYGEGFLGYLDSVKTTVEETREVMHGVGNVILSDYIGNLKEAYNEFAKAQNDVYRGVDGSRKKLEKAKAKVLELSAAMNNDKILSSIIANLPDYIPEEEIREQLNRIIGFFDDFSAKVSQQSVEQEHFWNNKRIAAMKSGKAKDNAQIDEDMRYEIIKYGDSEEHINLIKAEANRKRLEQQERYNEQAKNKAKQHAREMEAAEKELNSLRIQNMAEGLEKQLAQLKEERRQKILNAKENGIKVGEITEEINKLYEKKILEAREEWAYKIQQVYTNMWKNIFQINHQNAQMDFEDQLKQLELEYKALQDAAAKNSGTALGSYSNQGFSITKTKKKRAEESSTDSSDYKYKVLIEKDIDYTKRLREEFKKRTEDRKAYYAENERLTIEELDKQYSIEKEKAAENLNNELRTLVNSYNAQDHELKEHLKKGEITQAQYNEASKRLAEERTEQETKIQIKYHTESEQREREHREKIANAQNDSNTSILNNYQEMIEKLNSIDSSEFIVNGIGFLNITATRKRNKELIDAYKELSANLTAEINNLENKLKNSDLTEEQRKQINQLITIYNQLQAAIGGTVVKIQEDTKNATEEFVSNLNDYVQAVGQTMNTILSSLSEIQSNQYDKMIEQQEKYIDELKEMYDKQEAITQEHASEVNSIEDELSTARGDRRQQLIDQLNAEMAAQRASLAQQKKIEREQEKAEDKKKKLEHDQAVAKKKMQLAQAAINMAMSISMAAVNHWPIPAIPMMALAASAGAAQIAAIQSQNIPSYGSGGVIQGKSHKEGGVPVLGGRAEVEGGEYITNKVTTSKNVDLLEYINSKKKRINLDDLIEFYGGSSPVKKNIQTVRTKFADGGVVPTLRNDINLSDRLLTAFEDYSNRPQVVSVVEIVDKMQKVREVQTMAGLETNY